MSREHRCDSKKYNFDHVSRNLIFPIVKPMAMLQYGKIKFLETWSKLYFSESQRCSLHISGDNFQFQLIGPKKRGFF